VFDLRLDLMTDSIYHDLLSYFRMRNA